MEESSTKFSARGRRRLGRRSLTAVVAVCGAAATVATLLPSASQAAPAPSAAKAAEPACYAVFNRAGDAVENGCDPKRAAALKASNDAVVKKDQLRAKAAATGAAPASYAASRGTRRIGAIHQDVNYGGARQDLYVSDYGDCDYSGYRINLRGLSFNWWLNRYWNRVISSISYVPNSSCTAARLVRPRDEGRFWLPAGNIGRFNDDADTLYMYSGRG